jgi:hypothetical protein
MHVGICSVTVGILRFHPETLAIEVVGLVVSNT